MKRSLLAWILITAVLGGILLRGLDLMAPLENGHRGSCLAFFSLMAKNHQRYGMTATGGVAVLNPEKVEKEHFQYYAHHPPGAILLATAGAMLGANVPPALRLVFLPLALGIVVLTYRLARGLGSLGAVAAASIAALLPLGVYYGAFVNFEVPTLFFTMLTLHLHLRYLRRGRGADRARSRLAFAAAVACDWIALGLPLLLLLPWPEHRGDGRRAAGVSPRRAAAVLMAIGVLVVAAVKLQAFVQASRYGEANSGGLGYYLQVTPFAEGFRWSDWLFGSRPATGIFPFLRALVGIPVLALAACGLCLALRNSVRGRPRPADRAALTLLAIGAANVLILANWSWQHDYYLLYLLPALALLAALPFAALDDRQVPDRRRGLTRIGALALCLLLGWLALRSVTEVDQRRNYELAGLGESVRAETAPGSLVLMPHHYTLQVVVTADRHVDGAGSLAALELAIQRARTFGMGGRPIVYLAARGEEAKLEPALLAELDRRSRRSDRGPFTAWDVGVVEP